MNDPTRRPTRLGRPSPALLISVLALFVALGGSAYALSVREVQTRHLDRAAVTTAKLADRVAGARKTKRNSLGAGHMLQGFLDRIDGPKVPTGPAGGDLAGEYPNPTLADNEPFRIVGTAGEPPFQGGWSNFGAGFSRAGFFKDQQDIVHLSGSLTGGTTGQPVFTLPPGYRPSARLLPPFGRGDFSAGENLNLRIDPDGTVRFFCQGGCGGKLPGLDGVSFRVGPGSITPAGGSDIALSPGGSATD